MSVGDHTHIHPYAPTTGVTGTTLTVGHTAATQVTNTTWASGTFNVPNNNDEILKRLETIEAHLAIIKVDEYLLAKHPALKEAYDAYKLIEALLKDTR